MSRDVQDSPRLRVLLLEPDPREAEMQRLKLELDGYDVTVVPSHEAALRGATESGPDLIVLDSRRPGLDAAAAWTSIRNNASTRLIPVLILTEEDEARLAGRGIEVGELDLVIHSGTARVTGSTSTEGS